MRKKLESLRDVLIYQLKGLYDAEKQLHSTLSRCIKKASSVALKIELDQYAESQLQKIRKLELAFEYLSVKPVARINDTVEELIQETRELLKEVTVDEVRDALLIGCVQYMIHYKIAGYGLTAAFARELRLHDVNEILADLLDLEKRADKRLTKVAIEEINCTAVEKEYAQETLNR